MLNLFFRPRVRHLDALHQLLENLLPESFASGLLSFRLSDQLSDEGKRRAGSTLIRPLRHLRAGPEGVPSISVANTGRIVFLHNKFFSLENAGKTYVQSKAI